MTNIGFTGSRTLSDEEGMLIERILWRLDPEQVITGACIGVDEFVAEFFAANKPKVKQTIYVPGDRSRVNMRFIDRMLLLPQVYVVFKSKASTYRDRNVAIVEASDVLYGFPPMEESHPNSQRSGTWQTIRIARKAEKPVHTHILSRLGTDPAAS